MEIPLVCKEHRMRWKQKKIPYDEEPQEACQMLKITTLLTENLIEIEILGQKIPFLVDNGAAISMLKQYNLKVIPSKK